MTFARSVKRTSLLLVCAWLAAGCAKKEFAVPAEAPQLEASRTASLVAGAPRRADNTLAYEHEVRIEIEAHLLPARVEAVRSACASDETNHCTLLEISNGIENEVPQGSIRVRVGPGGVDALVNVAESGGRVLDKRTHAEDLAQPLADTDRQLSLLNLHRQRLTEFMTRKDMGVEQLITVSKELATVQAQLEEFGSQRANLRRRIDTDLLTISWRPPFEAYSGAQTPVSDAIAAFGSNFRDAIAQVLVFLAYVLPWLVIVVPALIGLRWLWRGIGHWLNQRRTA